MKKTITYVKYPNRRIYDTEASAYVSFASLREKIMEGHTLVVLDNKTKNDVTREVLISILLEESLVKEPLFPEYLMLMIIRLYGNPFQDMLIEGLNQNMGMLNTFWDGASSNTHDLQGK